MCFCHTVSMNVYLVGGAVRDLLLGRLPREWDYAFDGSREAFLAEHPDAAAVGAVQVCLWRGCEFMPLRGASLPDDLRARDLTINALALDAAGRLHCHPQALHDLRHRLLRPVSPWFAELEEAARIPAGPPRWHGRDSVLDHTCSVMDRCAGDALAAWMALCHDLGKLRTPADNWPHHYGHDALGVSVAQALCRRLALSNLHLKAAETACAEHMRAGRYGELRVGTRRDILWRVERRGLSRPFWRLVDADSRRGWSTPAERELAILRAVRLPDEWRDRGPASAQHLRDLQCAALVAAAD